MNEICSDPTLFNSIEMKNHILNQDPFDNHRSQLLKLIIDYYLLHNFEIKSFRKDTYLIPD